MFTLDLERQIQQRMNFEETGTEDCASRISAPRDGCIWGAGSRCTRPPASPPPPSPDPSPLQQKNKGIPQTKNQNPSSAHELSKPLLDKSRSRQFTFRQASDADDQAGEGAARGAPGGCGRGGAGERGRDGGGGGGRGGGLHPGEEQPGAPPAGDHLHAATRHRRGGGRGMARRAGTRRRGGFVRSGESERKGGRGSRGAGRGAGLDPVVVVVSRRG